MCLQGFFVQSFQFESWQPAPVPFLQHFERKLLSEKKCELYPILKIKHQIIRSKADQFITYEVHRKLQTSGSRQNFILKVSNGLGVYHLRLKMSPPKEDKFILDPLLRLSLILLLNMSDFPILNYFCSKVLYTTPILIEFSKVLRGRYFSPKLALLVSGEYFLQWFYIFL